MSDLTIPNDTRMFANHLAAALVNALTDRSGFDGFWDGCDHETKKEILVELRGIIETHLEAIQNE